MLKLWLLNSEEEITKKLKTISAIHTSEVNGANTLDFECYEAVEKGERVIYQDEQNKWHEFIVQEVTENKLTNVIYAEHSSYELRGDFVEDKRPTGNANVHLAVLLENTRWTIGTVDGLPSKFLSYYRQDVYKSINVMVELFQAYRTFEITVVGNKVTERKVNIKKNAGYDNGKRFVYSKDLIGVERTVLIGDVVTAIYGFGKGEEIGDGYGRRINFSNLNFADSPIGQMFIGDEVARQEFGRNSATGKKHVFTSVEFDDIEDTTELYHATKAKLQELNKPRINYKANVILLEEQFENVDLGDNVSIIDENFRGRELRIEGQVFRVQKDLIDKTKSVVELGNYIEDLADSNKELIQYIKDFRDKAGVWDKSNAFDKDGQLQGSYIKDLLGAWNDLLNGSNGFVYAEPGEGIITYDRAIDDNPTSAIQIVGGGFRIANSKLPNGQWDWKTIGTGDGLAGEHIIANSITANQLRSDVGASLDLSSNDSINLIVSSINTKLDEVDGTFTELSGTLIEQSGRIDAAHDAVDLSVRNTTTAFEKQESAFDDKLSDAELRVGESLDSQSDEITDLKEVVKSHSASIKISDGSIASLVETSQEIREDIDKEHSRVNDEFTNITQTTDRIETIISTQRGLNLIKNSVMHNDNAMWDSSTKITPGLGGLKGADNLSMGTPANRGITGNGKDEQSIIINSRGTYSLSFDYLKQTLDGTVYVYMVGEDGARNNIATIKQPNQSGAKKMTEQHLLTDVNVGEIRIGVEMVGVSTSMPPLVASLMFTKGEYYEWTPADGEVYTTNITMDNTGIKVRGRNDNEYTQMTQDEFARYYNGQKVFTVNQVDTELQNLVVQGNKLEMRDAQGMGIKWINTGNKTVLVNMRGGK